MDALESGNGITVHAFHQGVTSLVGHDGLGVIRQEGDSVLIQIAIHDDTQGIGVYTGSVGFSPENFRRHVDVCAFLGES